MADRLVLLEEVPATEIRVGVDRLQRALEQHAERADPFLEAADGEFKQALAEAIDGLPERERLVTSLYYAEGLNLREIGAVLRVTESRACQLHGQALVRLKARLSQWREGPPGPHSARRGRQ